MKVRPLHDRILVKRIEEEERTKGGLIIPDTAKEKPQEGKVIAVGEGRVRKDGTLRPLARCVRSTCTRVTGCSSASTPVPKSRSWTTSI
jgi:co-chaperonin GroES (HSP10)